MAACDREKIEVIIVKGEPVLVSSTGNEQTKSMYQSCTNFTLTDVKIPRILAQTGTLKGRKKGIWRGIKGYGKYVLGLPTMKTLN